MIKITIIIPIYNVSKYIERCLLSVLNQTYENLEVILVDDCSPDDSIKIAQTIVSKHSKKDKVIFTNHQQNRGLSAARNTGIDIASGEYIYFLDSDDEITLNAIETLAEQIEKFANVDIVIGNFEVINHPTNKKDLGLKMTTQYIDSNNQILKAYVEYKWPVTAWNKLVKLSFLKKESLYFEEGIVHEDELWSFLLANKLNNMAVVNKITYKYYFNDGSITSKVTAKNVEGMCFIAEKINKLINKNIISASKENITLLEGIRNASIRLLFSSTEIQDKKKLFRRLREIRGVNQYLSINKIIISYLLSFPESISYNTLNLLLSKNTSNNQA